MAALQAHDWPGNIRELRNVLDRARLFADDGTVRVEHLPESLHPGVLRGAPPASSAAPPEPARRPAEIDDAALRQLATWRGLRQGSLLVPEAVPIAVAASPAPAGPAGR